MKPAPVIIEPFSMMGDPVAGETAEEVAHNLAGCTRVSLHNRCKPRRPLPDLRKVFQGHKLSDSAKKELRWVADEYERINRRQKPNPEPQTQEELLHA